VNTYWYCCDATDVLRIGELYENAQQVCYLAHSLVQMNQCNLLPTDSVSPDFELSAWDMAWIAQKILALGQAEDGVPWIISNDTQKSQN
jgi:hypothetical protein